MQVSLIVSGLVLEIVSWLVSLTVSLVSSCLLLLIVLWLVYELVSFGSDDTAIHLGQLCLSLSIFVWDRRVRRVFI